MYLTGVLLIAFPLFKFYQILKGEAGHSMVLNELVTDFRFMIFSDFIRQSGKTLRPVLAYGALFGFIGSLIYTFLSGGAVTEWVNPTQKFSVKSFFQNCARLFWKYLLLLILLGILLFVLFLVSGIFYFIFVLIAEGSSERGYVLWLLLPTILLAYLMTFGLVLSFYAKVMLSHEPRLSSPDAFWKSFSYVYKNQKTVVQFWLISLIGISITLIYIQIDRYLGMTSVVTVWVMLFIQQLTVFLRFYLKNWNYAAAAEFFKQNPVQLWQEPKQPEPEILPVVEEETEEDESTGEEE
ncbi:hypothetical protein AFM12_15205 [Jiulongibacter sediminis]|uniref:Uncharacterized protein n=2 Tax=Jiulongibacter sediminis TaxID=1605367 RepID=A0A0P7BYH9_9BACT|nr:hypothetical protein AFM12_15205 [Jiulongibacter sediminis]TBX22721.1 hypothetical protein TK44_15215 [Jiulongibacter sediminis]